MRSAVIFPLVFVAVAVGWPTSLAQTNVSSQKPDRNQIREDALNAMRDYELQPGQYPNSKLLLAAQGYAIATNYEQAITICEKLVTTEPKNALARRDLGFYFASVKWYDEAVPQLKAGWELGDELSLKMLAVIYAHTKRYEALRPFVPDLLKIRNTLPDADDRLQVVNVLILYSDHAAAPGENVFLRAIDGLSDDLILEREDTTKLVIRGWLQMGQEDRVEKLIAKAKEKAAKEELLNTVKAYEQHPDKFQDDKLLPVARGYFVENKFGKAEGVFKKFLAAEPNNAQAIRGLGSCYWFTERYEKAAAQFKQGWTLGDALSYEYFADMFSWMTIRNKDVTPFVPDALEIRDKVTDVESKHKLVQALISHSLALSPPDNKGIFLKAIDGLSDEFILGSKDTRKLVVAGLESFGETERTVKLKEKTKQ